MTRVTLAEVSVGRNCATSPAIQRSEGGVAQDPTKDLRVTTALKAIRRRIRNEGTARSKNKAAAAIDGSKLIQTLLSLDADSTAGIRDKALLLIGWYGALRRSEIAGMRREHLTLDDHGVAIELVASKADQTDSGRGRTQSPSPAKSPGVDS